MDTPLSSNLRSLQALLFDLDGTVADTHGLIMQSYDHALRTHLGQPARREIWETHVGEPLDVVLEKTYAHYGEPHTPELMHTVKQTYRTYMRANADAVRPFPGIPALLASLQERGIRMAIVTTKLRAMALHHLATTGLEAYFEFVVAGDDCHHHKPHPEPFLRALEALHVPPTDAAAIGDSQHDIRGAHAAGLYAVAACWGTDNRPALLAANPDLIAEEPQRILSLAGEPRGETPESRG